MVQNPKIVTILRVHLFLIIKYAHFTSSSKYFHVDSFLFSSIGAAENGDQIPFFDCVLVKIAYL